MAFTHRSTFGTFPMFALPSSTGTTTFLPSLRVVGTTSPPIHLWALLGMGSPCHRTQSSRKQNRALPTSKGCTIHVAGWSLHMPPCSCSGLAWLWEAQGQLRFCHPLPHRHSPRSLSQFPLHLNGCTGLKKMYVIYLCGMFYTKSCFLGSPTVFFSSHHVVFPLQLGM